MDNLRSTIARSTASTKLSVLRDNKRFLDDTLRASQAAQDALSDPWARLHARADAIQNLHLAEATSFQRLATDVLAFLRVQERYTTHRSVKQLRQWNERLDEEERLLVRKLAHADVYADAVEDWLAKDAQKDSKNRESSGSTWESPTNDLPPLPAEPFDPQAYLVSLDITPALLDGITALGKRANTFGSGQLKTTIHPRKIRDAMRTLSREARVYSADVRKQLVEESGKPMVLEELSGAMTQTWRSIATWQWPACGIEEKLQTHMNGKQRSFLSIDIVLAIFLQVIGDTWSEFFHQEFRMLRENEGWRFQAELEKGPMTLQEVEDVRRQLELINMEDPDGKSCRGDPAGGGITTSRRQDLKCNGSRILGKGSGYDSYDSEAEPSNDNNDVWAPILDATRPAKAYGDIFRLVTTDIVLARHIAPEKDLTVLHGDLQDFGRSVPHDVLLAVLKFFGVPPPWIQFFETYLRIPIIQPDGTIRIPTRGTPFGQACSTLVDELLLVVLDIAMASTAGMTAHRNHDDFWMWSLVREDMVKAWEVMQDFTARTGSAWNATKTSCTVVRGSAAGDKVDSRGLPNRLLRWGVLELQPDGTWSVDAQLVKEQADAAITDLQDKAPSFLGKIGVINKYQAYLIRNSGAPTQANGPEYLDIVRKVLAQFEERITGGQDIVGWMQDRFLEAFPDKDTDEALQIWPLKLGGFGLQSFGPCALAYEKQFGIYPPRASSRQPFGPDFEPRQRVYEKMQKIWSSPALSDAFVMSRRSDSALGRWIRTKRDLPPLVSFEAYSKWWIMHGADNLVAIQDATLQLDLEPSQVANAASQLYGRELKDAFGSDVVVSPELTPTYVILDIESRVKQLFAST